MAGLQGVQRADHKPRHDLITAAREEQERQVQRLQDRDAPHRGGLQERPSGTGQVPKGQEDGREEPSAGDRRRLVGKDHHHQGGLLRLDRREQRSDHGADEQDPASHGSGLHDPSAECLQRRRHDEHQHRQRDVRPIPHRPAERGRDQRDLRLLPCQGQLQRGQGQPLVLRLRESERLQQRLLELWRLCGTRGREKPRPQHLQGADLGEERRADSLEHLHAERILRREAHLLGE